MPQSADGADALLARLQQLPGFNNEAVIEAMSSADRTFVCWKRTGRVLSQRTISAHNLISISTWNSRSVAAPAGAARSDSIPQETLSLSMVYTDARPILHIEYVACRATLWPRCTAMKNATFKPLL